MKGVVVLCLKNMLKERYGKNAYDRILTKSGIDPRTIIRAGDDFEDELVFNIVQNTCAELDLTPIELSTQFGEYWMLVYAPKLYFVYFMGIDNSKDFILKMNEVHDRTTKNIPNSRPPRFEFKWLNDKHLIMSYYSHRPMVDYFVGLLKGVGKYFSEDLQVQKLDDKNVEIIFP